MAKKYPPSLIEFISSIRESEYEFAEFGGIQVQTLEKMKSAALACNVKIPTSEFLVAKFTQRIEEFRKQIEKAKQKFPAASIEDLARCENSKNERINAGTDFLIRTKFNIK